jgi:hypothetical protein
VSVRVAWVTRQQGTGRLAQYLGPVSGTDRALARRFDGGLPGRDSSLEIARVAGAL